MKQIKEIFFGVKVSGEATKAPTPRPMRSLIEDDFNNWTKEFKFGTRYGHKGSFYQSNKFTY